MQYKLVAIKTKFELSILANTNFYMINKHFVYLSILREEEAVLAERINVLINEVSDSNANVISEMEAHLGLVKKEIKRLDSNIVILTSCSSDIVRSALRKIGILDAIENNLTFNEPKVCLAHSEEGLTKDTVKLDEKVSFLNEAAITMSRTVISERVTRLISSTKDASSVRKEATSFAKRLSDRIPLLEELRQKSLSIVMENDVLLDKDKADMIKQINSKYDAVIGQIRESLSLIKSFLDINTNTMSINHSTAIETKRSIHTELDVISSREIYLRGLINNGIDKSFFSNQLVLLDRKKDMLVILEGIIDRVISGKDISKEEEEDERKTLSELSGVDFTNDSSEFAEVFMFLVKDTIANKDRISNVIRSRGDDFGERKEAFLIELIHSLRQVNDIRAELSTHRGGLFVAHSRISKQRNIELKIIEESNMNDLDKKAMSDVIKERDEKVLSRIKILISMIDKEIADFDVLKQLAIANINTIISQTIGNIGFVTSVPNDKINKLVVDLTNICDVYSKTNNLQSDSLNQEISKLKANIAILSKILSERMKIEPRVHQEELQLAA